MASDDNMIAFEVKKVAKELTRSLVSKEAQEKIKRRKRRLDPANEFLLEP